MARPSKYGEHRDQVLTLIRNAAARHSPPPTIRFLAGELQVGVATVHGYLGRLSEEGLVEWQPKTHRSLRLTPRAFQSLPSLAAPPR